MTVQELYAEIGGNYERVRGLLQADALIARFVRKLPDDKAFETLSEGWRAGDRQRMFEGAHALKGICGNLGLDTLSRDAAAITEECRPGSAPGMSAAELDAFMQRFQADYERTLEAIGRFAAEA